MSHENHSGRGRNALLIALCLLAVLAFATVRPITHQFRLWRARQAISNRDPQQALAWLAAAERSGGKDGAVSFLMARAHRHLEAYNVAMEDLRQAHRLGYPIEALEREKLLAMAESAELPPHDPRLQALLANPGNDLHEVYEALVKGYYRLYELGPARLVLDSWEENFPNDPQPKSYRGLLSEHDEELREAEKWFRQAIDLAPHRRDIRLQLAQVLRKQHRCREAIQHYYVCLQEEEDAKAFFGLGKCLQARGELPQSRGAFLKGLRAVPNDYDCLLALGELDVDAGKGRDALRWLEPAANLKPREYDVRYALAKALLYAGDGNGARPHFQFAAQARLALSQVKALRQYVASHPEDAERRYEIGVALLEYGDIPEGIKWLQSVFKYQPEHHKAQAALAAFHARQGDADAAPGYHAPADGKE